MHSENKKTKSENTNPNLFIVIWRFYPMDDASHGLRR
jgi:hypothetical protein